jgi:hypothetical protein
MAQGSAQKSRTRRLRNVACHPGAESGGRSEFGDELGQAPSQELLQTFLR